jgi:hypothetical protein
MVRMPWLALAAGLLLFGCAAAPAPKEQAQAEPQQAKQCLTISALKENMGKEPGVKQKADLEGEPLTAFIEWIEPQLGGQKVPAQTVRALMFEQEGAVLIIWFGKECALGHVSGPWEPIKAFLLSRPAI